MKKFNTMWYHPEFIAQVSVKCKCGHVVQIVSRRRREYCSWCGTLNFLTKKDEFKYKLMKEKKKCEQDKR